MVGIFYFLSVMEGTTNRQDLRISQLAIDDRPREKLLQKGLASLSDAELIAILIGSGTQDLNAIDLSKLILASANNNLNDLARLQISDLVKFRGIGEAKAINIVSALEIGRRRKESQFSKKEKVTSSSEAYKIIKPALLDLRHEEFWIILLNRANTVIKKSQISHGGVSGTLVDSKIIFKEALDNLASNIILIHNHPSGNLQPSLADKKLTKKLQGAGKLLDIPVIDHIIFTDNGYFSFADEGLLE